MEPRPIGRGNPEVYTLLEALQLASMEPRPIGRGNAGRIYPITRQAIMLQWSHVLLDVETIVRRLCMLRVG